MHFLNEMNIAIIGYGNMGKMVEQAALSRGHAIKSIIDPKEQKATHSEINSSALKNVDVCIDFTLPAVVLENIRKVSGLKKNIVVGTTGWNDKAEEAKGIVAENKIGLIYASNFSIGVNIFYRIVENAAKIFNRFDDYDSYVYELHHRRKHDAPSGTAKSIGEILVKNLDRKKALLFEQLNRKINDDELHVASIRAGAIPGTHVVGFDSEADNIEMRHEARSRKGFAVGAVLAAEWIHGKKGFYTINDMMKEIVG